MKSTVVDESLSSFKPMYCSREYQASTRLIQQYEKSTLKIRHAPVSHQINYVILLTSQEVTVKVEMEVQIALLVIMSPIPIDLVVDPVIIMELKVEVMVSSLMIHMELVR